MPNNESALADIYRHLDPKHFTGLPDDEVLGAAKQLDPKYNDRYRQLSTLVATQQSQENQSSLGNIVGGLVSPDTGVEGVMGAGVTAANIGQAMGRVAQAGHNVAAAIPGMSQVAAGGRWAASQLDNVQQAAEAKASAEAGQQFKMAGIGPGGIARAVLPQTEGSAALMALPFAGEALGGMLPAARVAGEAAPLAEAGGTANKVISAGGRAATGVQQNVFGRILGDSGRILRPAELAEAAGTETAKEAAGQVMNAIAEQHGVKTGKEALMQVPAYARTRKTESLVPYVEDVAEGLPRVKELEQLRAAQAELNNRAVLTPENIQRLKDLSGGAPLSGTEAKPLTLLGENMGMSPSAAAENELSGLGWTPPRQIPEHVMSAERVPAQTPEEAFVHGTETRPEGISIRGAGQQPPPATPMPAYLAEDAALREKAGKAAFAESGGKTPAENFSDYVKSQLNEQVSLAKQKSDIANRIKQLEQPVHQGGAPTMQDVVTARQVQSNRLSAPSFQSDIEGMDKGNQLDRLNDFDDMLEHMEKSKPPVKGVDVPGYGKVKSMKQARQIWSESADHDELQQLTPVNNNHTPSVLRMWGPGTTAATALATGHPIGALAAAGSYAATSPRAWGVAIRMVEHLRGLAAGTGEAASALGNAKAAGPLANIGQEMSDEKK